MTLAEKKKLVAAVLKIAAQMALDAGMEELALKIRNRKLTKKELEFLGVSL